MAFVLKDKIFRFFGIYETITDTLKDNVTVPGKGIKQRYYESIAEDFDEELIPLIDLYIDNLIPPQTILAKFLFLAECMWGGLVILLPTETLRRKVLRFANHILTIKSTIPSYELLFRMLGSTSVVITEDFTKYGFDSAVTFDDPDRVFDNACPTCSTYDVTLTGGPAITDDLQFAFFRIINFLEPINAQLGTFLYDGLEIVFGIIFDIFIDLQSGRLIYERGIDGTITFTVNDQGKLIIDGDTENNYSIDADGHLIFTQ